MIDKFNKRNPQCPVLMQSIEFNYNPRNKLKTHGSYSNSLFSIVKGDATSADMHNIEETRVPYIFPGTFNYIHILKPIIIFYFLLKLVDMCMDFLELL
jgi:hypothetical protein